MVLKQTVQNQDCSIPDADDHGDILSSAMKVIEQPGGKLLNRLSVELLQHIASFLPPSSAGAFALSSKYFLQALGHSYFDELKKGKRTIMLWSSTYPKVEYTKEQAEWQRFLLLLDKYSRRTIFCHFCQKLHNSEKDISTTCRYLDHCIRIYGWKGFNRLSIFAAMKLHRLGNLDTNTLNRLSRTFTIYRPEYVSQRAIKVKIISGSFYVRLQHRILYPPRQTLEFRDEWRDDTGVCPHMMPISDSLDPLSKQTGCRLKKLIQCRFAHQADSGQCSTCSGLQQCKDCLTEFQVDGMFLRNARFAIIITQWQDLGECFTPFDAKWLCHVENFPELDSKSPTYVKRIFEGADFDFRAPITLAEEDALINWPSYKFERLL